MKTPLLVAAIAAGMTLAATAEARDGRGAAFDMPTFEELDANADGGITMDEIEAAMAARAAERFAEADTDGDGALSAEEMLARASEDRAARMADRIADRIEKIDANGDGVLQLEEMQARADDRRGPSPDRMFNRADADDNGSLSAEEFAQAQERMSDRRPRGGHGGHGGHGGRNGG